ncbi:uncharacterized protein LOC143376372 [Andrena cerasifolii]|uniref:uncharacterized protein LOC143376372 n=1 Tax=Andrena cerasifolii TaxID=2819439 RepID=UPI0040378635
MLVVAKLETLNVVSFLYRMARAVVKSSRVTNRSRVESRWARSQPLIDPSKPLFRLFAGFLASLGWSSSGTRRVSRAPAGDVPAPLAPQRRARLHCPSRHPGRSNNNNNNNRPIGSISGTGLDRRHNCSRCGKSYKNAYILKRHLLYECGKAPSFNCPHCTFSSKYERNLKAHINHRHVASQTAQSTGTVASTTVNQRA